MVELHTVRGSVFGKVQGVWYRAFTRETARRAGLQGYARNEPDGSVSFALSGPRDRIELVLEAMRAGPPLAEVTRLNVQWQAHVPMSGFETS